MTGLLPSTSPPPPLPHRASYQQFSMTNSNYYPQYHPLQPFRQPQSQSAYLPQNYNPHYASSQSTPYNSSSGGASNPHSRTNSGGPPNTIPVSSAPQNSNYDASSAMAQMHLSDSEAFYRERSIKEQLEAALDARMTDIDRLECDLRRSSLEKKELSNKIASLMAPSEGDSHLGSIGTAGDSTLFGLHGSSPATQSNINELSTALSAERSESTRLRAELEAATLRLASAQNQNGDLANTKPRQGHNNDLERDASKTALTERFAKEKGALLDHISLAEGNLAKAEAIVAELQTKTAELEAINRSNLSLTGKHAREMDESKERIAALLTDLTKANSIVAESETKYAELESSCIINKTLAEQYAKEKRELLDQISTVKQEATRNSSAFSEFKTRTAVLEDILHRKDKEIEDLRASSMASLQKMDATIVMLTNSLNQQSSIAAADIDRLSKCLQQEVQAKEAALHKLSKIPPDPLANWTRNAVKTGNPPRDPPLPRGADADHWALFCKADPLYTKRLDAGQLGTALSNGPWPPLSIRAIVFLIRTYDRNGDFVDFEFFTRAWPQMHEWKQVGIQVPSKVLELIFKRMKLTGDLVGWDDFVCLASRLQAQINDFDRMDTDRDKVITILYDQYLDIINRCVF
ncbi:hypothetical protein BSLG_001737 [Batrachochytrium salamandrivorans]|nr:hypothetical protein BSLG_001737 [Batrachochytrium salamandrivorans]